MPDIPFTEYADRLQELLQQGYGIPVVTRDIPDPLTGDLNGAEIDLDYAITPELRLFLLAHLFGHTVQWNVNESSFDLGRQYKPPVDEKLFPHVVAYETEAACYGLSLLHQGRNHRCGPVVLKLCRHGPALLAALLSHGR